MTVLQTAAQVFRLIADRERDVTVSDISAGLSLPKSSASRLLRQLAECGMLERDPRSKAYRPSLLMLEVAHQVRASAPLVPRMEAALRQLVHETGHTGYISVLDASGAHVTVLRVQNGAHPLRVLTQPGHRLPAFATSTGRALLARLSDDAVRARYAQGIGAVASQRAPRSVDALLEELRRVREQGWAMAVDEALQGVGSISSSVREPETGDAYAFCLSFPAALAGRSLIDTLTARLVGEARSIGRAAGDSFWEGKIS
jgi:DNA-binding IclR family transcriptional regulator